MLKRVTIADMSARIFRQYSLVLGLGLFLWLLPAGQSAHADCPCCGCPPPDVRAAVNIIGNNHESIRKEIDLEFAFHQSWLINDFYYGYVLPSLQKMATQLSTVGLHQVYVIGTYFDAKQQLETQRQFQELAFQAHKDYQPSESFCAIGTSVRSLAASERRAHLNTQALNMRQMGRHLGRVGTPGAEGRSDDKQARWVKFRKTYCNTADNNWRSDSPDSSGLAFVCETSPGSPDSFRPNRDIDFKRTLWAPRTLNVSFMKEEDDNTGASEEASFDEQDVIALGNNLFGHDVLTRELDEKDLSERGLQEFYLDLRSVAAKRNVAENSYNALVGLKSEGSPVNREYLKVILRNLGVQDDQMAEFLGGLGDKPSLYAQLEILSQRLFQDPGFFAKLYDTPVNVKRKAVALRAIELMLDRAIYESQMRQEMVTSVLLSSGLRPEFEKINARIE